MNMVEQQDSRHYRQPNPYAAPPPPQQSHRGSPVLGQLDQRPQHSSTPSPTYGYAQLPSMAQQHPPRSMPTSYPVSSSYAPPVMGYPQYPVAHQNSYPIPTSAPQQLGLPSIRSLPPANGVQLGSTLPSLNSPYQFQGHLPSPQNITSQPQMVHPGMRVPYPSGMPLGAANERVMSGGRHKKEIKRRTKTGCLTCRKRRIKCDEGHPTCKNCQKSKRECAGYDPIFKPQPGPTAIQPAPTSGMGISQQQMGMQQPSGQYPMQTALAPLTYVPTSRHQTSTPSSSPGSNCDTYPEYPVDPNLESLPPALPPTDMMPMTSSILSDSYLQSGMKRSYDQTSIMSAMSEPPSSIPARASMPGTPGSPYNSDSQAQAKRIKIDDLIQSNSTALYPLSPPIVYSSPAEVRTLYEVDLMNALDRFFDTNWFSTKGLEKISTSESVLDGIVSAFVRKSNTLYPEAPISLGTVDEDVELLCAAFELVYGISITRHPKPTSSTAGKTSEDWDSKREEVANRLDSIRALLKEIVISNNAVESPQQSPKTTSDNVTKFWNYIRKVASFDASIDTLAALDTWVRVIYEISEEIVKEKMPIISIAETRYLAQRLIAPALEDPQHASMTIPTVKERMRQQYDYIRNNAEGNQQNVVIHRISAKALATIDPTLLHL